MAARRAIVTGASGGIGRELARLLAAAGYDLTLVARSREALETHAASLRAAYRVAVSAVVLDLADGEAARDLFARLPACEVLVNNAGFGKAGPFAFEAERDVLEQLQLNVTTLTELTRRYLPGMLQRKRGRILNVASTAAFAPGPNMAVYYATKAYVLSFSEALACEVRGSGVTITTLCPGATATGFQTRAGQRGMTLLRFGVADAASVARAGFNAMMNGKRLCIPGTLNAIAAFAPRLVPRAVVLWVSKQLAST